MRQGAFTSVSSTTSKPHPMATAGHGGGLAMFLCLAFGASAQALPLHRADLALSMEQAAVVTALPQSRWNSGEDLLHDSLEQLNLLSFSSGPAPQSRPDHDRNPLRQGSNAAPARFQFSAIPDWMRVPGDGHLYGSLGYFGSAGESAQHSYASMDFSWNHAWTRGRLYLQGQFIHRLIKLKQELKDRERANAGSNGKVDREVVNEDSYWEWGDSYFQYDPSESLRFSVVRKRIVWGQMDILSPINLLLPIKLQNRDFGAGKVGYRMPQDQ